MNIGYKITIAVIAVFLVLLAVGISITPGMGSYAIGSCNGTWSWTPRVVHSDLCPAGNATCVTTPMAEQHNALVDVLLCACSQAASQGYADSDTNSKIESLYSQISGYSKAVGSLCSQPDITKWTYG